MDAIIVLGTFFCGVFLLLFVLRKKPNESLIKSENKMELMNFVDTPSQYAIQNDLNPRNIETDDLAYENDNKENEPLSSIKPNSPVNDATLFLPLWVFFDGVKKLNLTLRILYTPYQKEAAERTITTAFYNKKTKLICAFCHTHNMYLTFNRKNIEWMEYEGLTITSDKIAKFLNSKSTDVDLLPNLPDFRHFSENINVLCKLHLHLKGNEYIHKNRVVEVSIYNHVEGFIYGKCLTSNQFRFFYLQSIVNCLNENGEDITNVLRSYIRKHRV